MWPARRPRRTCHNPGVASRWANWQHAALRGAGVIASATGLAVFALPQPAEGSPSSSYAGHSPAAAALFVAAGLGLTLAGLAASRTRQAPHLADLAMLAGFLWFAPAWVGWHGGPPLARSLGMVASAFVLPVIVHVVLAFLDGRGRRPAASALIIALYVEAALSALVLALVRDPFYDPTCWNNCTDNVFLIHSMPDLAHAVQVTDRWFVALAATAFAGMCDGGSRKPGTEPEDGPSGGRSRDAAGVGRCRTCRRAPDQADGGGIQPGVPGHLLRQLRGGHPAGRWVGLARDAHPRAAARGCTDRIPPRRDLWPGLVGCGADRGGRRSGLGSGLPTPRLEPVRGCRRQARASARRVAWTHRHSDRPRRATDRGGVAQCCALRSRAAHRSRDTARSGERTTPGGGSRSTRGDPGVPCTHREDRRR